MKHFQILEVMGERFYFIYYSEFRKQIEII